MVNARSTHPSRRVLKWVRRPDVWGSGVNTVVKQLMLEAAMAAGAEWVQRRTDERNLRSAAAIARLNTPTTVTCCRSSSIRYSTR